MLMFRFWNSDHKGSDKVQQVDYPMLDFTAKPVQPWISTDVTIPASLPQPKQPPKRRRQSNAAIASPVAPAAKRPKASDEGHDSAIASESLNKARLTSVTESAESVPALGSGDRERMVETIEEQFSLEILLKHDELRLINQELAKCQVALEQLRRCHLIPYPINVPTPEQMLNISNGTGPSLQPKEGTSLPQWAPPFGVTDGPYARHYAKWLIPDPKFDGIQPEIPAHGEAWRVRSAIEGRSTRNSSADFSTPQNKGRPSRSTAGQKLHALSSGYPVHKDKNGPCVLKRSDGQTVKLVCIDCHRENFSSTQGFINHCRIAHKRDFKSHEEAAVHCGHPIDAPESAAHSRPAEEKPVVLSAPPSGIVHPFARENAMSDSEACFSVVRRIEESVALYRQGGLSGASFNAAKQQTKAAASNKAASFSPATSSPHLTRHLQSRGFAGDLGSLVADAQTKVDMDMASQSDDESEDQDSLPTPVEESATGVRVPARAAMAPTVTSRPLSSKGSLGLARPPAFVTPVPPPTVHLLSAPTSALSMDEDMMDPTELSPNMPASNNAPSLVSDDGEYDDSADSDSASETHDSIGAETISDVDEMDIDEDHASARVLRHQGAGAGTRMRLARSDAKHVNFVSPVKERQATRGRGINLDTIP
ncbi:hypothetical protein F5Y16DRAFT_200599 [Xylariaceae sp. FL0255]|nr:hypothetical protein F5Y16DRAFT_200599 [Xylariaceae sp. FL0255]